MASIELMLCKTNKFFVIEKGKQEWSTINNSTTPTLDYKYGHPKKCQPKLHIFLDINEPYTREIILKSLRSRAKFFGVTLGPGFGTDEVVMPPGCHFQWAEYERIDWKSVLAGQHGASSYCVRKGLSRKAQLSYYTSRYVRKHPDSILRDAIPFTILIDTWSVWDDQRTNHHHHSSSSAGANENQFVANLMVNENNGMYSSSSSSAHHIRQRLHHCLVQAQQAMANAEHAFENGTLDAPPIWILKPSTVNKGAGIRIVHLYEQVLDICWEESDIREWVLQQYISSPLLLNGRKFHIRAYALAVGSIKVYLSENCLALCSGTKYHHDTSDYFAHITNTAYQEQDPNFHEEDCVRLWTEEDVGPILVANGICCNLTQARHNIETVKSTMDYITADLFRAFQNEFSVFSPMEGCFEQYGLDFIIDNDWQVYLLEVNPGPDFKQTGNRLSPVIETFMGDTVDVALKDVQRNCEASPMGSLRLVYDHQRLQRMHSLYFYLRGSDCYSIYDQGWDDP